MAITARKVRWTLLATASLLVAVILGFAGYAHYRARHFLQGLPHKLGVDIKQETDGFTYSQSVGGRTVFTVHASKEIQRANGRITLHDVGIILYGRTPGSADRIHGSDFEFDPANGVLTAAGEVYLDLEAPVGSLPTQSNAGSDSRMVHVKTSGLTFLEKERSANTDQAIEFSAGGLTGRAVGASYDSAGGLVVLKRDVEMHGERGGRPLTLTASRAEIDRNANVVRLTASTAAEVTPSGVERLSAQRTILQLTADGAPLNLEGEGQVLFAREGSGTLSGDRLSAEFNRDGAQGSVLRRAHLSGNVRLHDNTPGNMRQGHAADVNVLFDSEGRAERADLNGGVSLEIHRGAAAQMLVSSRVQLGFQSTAAGKSVLRVAEAFGDNGPPVRVHLIAPQSKGAPGQVVTDVAGQHLRAQFISAGKALELKSVDGEGQTAVEQISTDAQGGKVSAESSAADFLHAELTRGAGGRMLLAHAEQHGHVTGMRQIAARRGKGRSLAAETERARAADAVFDAASNRVQLTGAVEVADPSSELFADNVALDRGSGITTANGSVRVSYLQPGSNGEPLHITAVRAESDRTSGVTRFFGANGGSESTQGAEARLWQGGSQVEAAEIDFDRNQRQVIANGGAGVVRAVLASAGQQASRELVRVASRELTYTDSTRQVSLTGAVKLTQAEGSLQSASAVVFLAPPANADAQKSGQVSGAPGLMGGKVERIVAEGAVQLQQPGRRATGTQLVYTAADQTYILSGTRAAPPRLMDETRGTITGASLRFRGGDDSVEILGGQGQRVESQTRLKTTPQRK